MHCTHKLGRIVNREEDNLCGRRDSTYLVGCLDAIHHRHVDVKKNDIRLQLDDFFDGLFTTLSITADLEGMPVEKRTNGGSRRQVEVLPKIRTSQ